MSQAADETKNVFAFMPPCISVKTCFWLQYTPAGTKIIIMLVLCTLFVYVPACLPACPSIYLPPSLSLHFPFPPTSTTLLSSPSPTVALCHMYAGIIADSKMYKVIMNCDHQGDGCLIQLYKLTLLDALCAHS